MIKHLLAQRYRQLQSAQIKEQFLKISANRPSQCYQQNHQPQALKEPGLPASNDLIQNLLQ